MACSSRSKCCTRKEKPFHAILLFSALSFLSHSIQPAPSATTQSRMVAVEFCRHRLVDARELGGERNGGHESVYTQVGALVPMRSSSSMSPSRMNQSLCFSAGDRTEEKCKMETIVYDCNQRPRSNAHLLFAPLFSCSLFSLPSLSLALFFSLPTPVAFVMSCHISAFNGPFHALFTITNQGCKQTKYDPS